MIAEGGTQQGHCVSIARGPSPVGPWEGAPSNPILTNRSTDRPIQNTGHADMVQATDGSWWMVLLGVRPRGPRLPRARPRDLSDPGRLGRRLAGSAGGAIGDGRPPPWTRGARGRAAVSDDFDSAELGPRWVGVRRSPSRVASLEARPGWLVIHGAASTLDTPEPAFVGRRQQHQWCRVRARTEAGRATEAGVTLLMDETAHYDVVVRRGEILARVRIGPLDAIVGPAPCPTGPVVLTIATGPHAHGPDAVTLGYEDEAGAPHRWPSWMAATSLPR